MDAAFLVNLCRPVCLNVVFLQHHDHTEPGSTCEGGAWIVFVSFPLMPRVVRLVRVLPDLLCTGQKEQRHQALYLSCPYGTTIRISYQLRDPF